MKINIQNLNNVNSGFEFETTDRVIFVKGGNGSGKTTFCETLISALSAVKKGRPSDWNAANLDTNEKGVYRFEFNNGDKLEATVDGSSKSLVYISKQGKKEPVSKQLAEVLIGRGLIDIHEFLGMSHQKKADAILQVLGIDTSKERGEYSLWYEQRTLYNKVKKTAAEKAKGVIVYEGIEKVNTSSLNQELSLLFEQKAYFEVAENIYKNNLQKIADLKAEIAKLENQNKSLILSIKEKDGEQIEAEIHEVSNKIKNAEAQNDFFAQNEQNKALKQAALDAANEYETINERVLAVKKAIHEKIATADLPNGLTFVIDDNGIPILHFEGLPLNDSGALNTARTILACVKLTLLGWGNLPFISIEGSLLGQNILDELAKEAEKHGVTIFVERVVIEDTQPLKIEVYEPK